MNIMNRIKKIEMQTEGTPEICKCSDTWKFETVYHENGKPATSVELLPKPGDLVPDTCGKCLKPVIKTTIIVDYIDAKSEVKL